ncbi:glycosyl transferase family 2 [Cytophagales bacterium WSM2-2]|nr:glycosyl transferase family 2 [Cytophagales bacterium WSM2-2]
MEKIRASIVVYETEPHLLKQAMESFLNSPMAGQLTIIDNSPTDFLRQFSGPRVEYIFVGKNVGYGKAHNLAMSDSLEKSHYHIVLNPDVCFNPGTLERIYDFMEDNPQAGLAMPKVYGTDGELQMMCKLLPQPLNLFLRRFFPFDNWFKGFNDYYEMKNTGYNRVMNVPFLSGCFMFLRTSALKRTGLFDERFFLYAEDTDLSRRIHQQFETLFFPDAEITHVHARGSYKNFKLTIRNAISAIQYFNKWGWFIDAEREIINERAMATTNLHVQKESLSEVRAA